MPAADCKDLLMTRVLGGLLSGQQVRTSFLCRFECGFISPFLDGDVEPYAFLKYGRERQIPVTYLMASWDNLQNKGVAQPAPDQYLVWTDEHKRQMI
ncbi:MAG: hypothetical protein EBY32_19805, partial [Proteobacteria bacterium]|nr:hypothetical protein [Pseudomonadota bacterium]